MEPFSLSNAHANAFAGATLRPGDTVDSAVQRIQGRLTESGFDWDVSRGDLRDLNHTLGRLDADARNQVISRLTDETLQKWGNEIASWANGLSHSERTDLFNTLSPSLDAQQLGRFYNALGENLQPEFARAIEQHAGRQTQLDFPFDVQQRMLREQGTPSTEGLSPEQIELTLDLGQVALDIVGLADPTPISDGVNGVISLCRGDFLGAGISALSMIPYVGDLAKAGKLGKWAETVDGVVRMAARDARFAEQVRPILNKIRDGIEAIPQGMFKRLPQEVQDGFKKIARQIDELNLRGDTQSRIRGDGSIIPPHRPVLNDTALNSTRPQGIHGDKPYGMRSTNERNAHSEPKRGIRRENQSADRLAYAGYRVHQQPVETGLLTREHQKSLGLDPDKKPDYLIEGRVFDAYAPTSPKVSGVYGGIAEKVGKNQAHRIVLNLVDTKVSYSEINKYLNANPIDKLREVIVIEQNGNIRHWLPNRRTP